MERVGILELLGPLLSVHVCMKIVAKVNPD